MALQVPLHSGIAADIDGSCQKVFIPAALPSKEPCPCAPSVSVLCASFKTQKDAWSEEYTNLPQGVFCRVVVELAQGPRKVCPTESTHASVRFLWKNSHILLMECLNRIEVAVTFQEAFVPLHFRDIDMMKITHEYCCEVLELMKRSLEKVSEEMFGEHNHGNGDVIVGFQCPCSAPFSHIAKEEHMSIRCVGGEMRNVFQKLSLDQLIWFTPIQANQAKVGHEMHRLHACTYVHVHPSTGYQHFIHVCQFILLNTMYVHTYYVSYYVYVRVYIHIL